MHGLAAEKGMKNCRCSGRSASPWPGKGGHDRRAFEIGVLLGREEKLEKNEGRGETLTSFFLKKKEAKKTSFAYFS
jgi:hypothetical protein